MHQFQAVISLTGLRALGRHEGECIFDYKAGLTSASALVRVLASRAKYGVVLMTQTVLFGAVLPTRAQESTEMAKQVQNPIANLISTFVRLLAFRAIYSVLLMTLIVLCGPVLPTQAQESPEIAKQAQNPIANLISVPLENDFNPQTGIDKDDSYVLEMKPVIPFHLSNDWTLITRTIIPVIQVPDLTPRVGGTTGLGDVQESFFLSPTKAGPVIWGAGPVITLPTATQGILGTKKLSLGPTVVVLRIQGHWLFGTLAQNLWSVEGPSARPDVNQMLLQPFVNYNLRHKWYLTSSPIITANWEVRPDERWVVPVGGGVGKIVHFGRQPVNVYTQLFRNVERPDGTTHWSARFQMQFLFPKKR
jgi:hypothetical protein